MTIPHENFCVLPWISLEASPIGTVRPCCLARDEIKDHTGEKVRLGSRSLDKIRRSPDMQTLRDQFLAGQRPSTCDRCWQEEDSGRTSKRMHSLQRLQPVIKDQHWDPEPKELMFLDLKLGNICNLKCRICGSWSSSSYATEEIQFLPPGSDRKSSYHYQMLRQGAWPRNEPAFWQDIERYLDHIRYIEFTGGEPFMITEHFDLLRTFVDRGIANQVEIHYNTNGTHWPAHAENLWREFRHVEIAFSIDDVGTRFEYQRHGARWDQVQQNLQRAQKFRDRSNNVTLQVCCTINILNVLYLGEVANWIDEQKFDFVYWNMLHDAPHWNIRCLPHYAREYVANVLQWAKVSECHRAEFQRAVQFMRDGAPGDLTQTITAIRELDTRRGESLEQVAPALAYIIRYDPPPV